MKTSSEKHMNDDRRTQWDRREFLVRTGIGLAGVALGGPLLVSCVGSSRSVSAVAMSKAVRPATLDDIMTNLGKFTPVVFGESKTHGIAYLEARYARHLNLGSYVRVERDRSRVEAALEAVRAADPKAKLQMLRIKNDQSDAEEMGFALGGVGRMTLNAETGALTVQPFDPAANSSEGGGGGGGGGGGSGGGT